MMFVTATAAVGTSCRWLWLMDAAAAGSSYYYSPRWFNVTTLWRVNPFLLLLLKSSVAPAAAAAAAAAPLVGQQRRRREETPPLWNMVDVDDADGFLWIPNEVPDGVCVVEPEQKPKLVLLLSTTSQRTKNVVVVGVELPTTLEVDGEGRE